MELGFIGLGQMGGRMAIRLLDAGYSLTVFDRDEAAMAKVVARGARRAASAAEVGAASETVLMSLPTPDIVRSVVLGPDGVTDSNRATRLVDLSTTGPRMATHIAAELDKTGRITLIDAPVSGGVSGATAGTLMIMVGGPSAAFERFQPMLATLGKKVVHAGDVGAGHAVKALNNLMSAAHLLASSEALIAGRRFGLDPAVMLEIVNGASGRSGSTENKWPNYVLTEKYDAGFSIRLMVKDVKLALSIEHATGVPAAASEAVVATWEAALADLPPDADHTAIARWLADRTKE